MFQTHQTNKFSAVKKGNYDHCQLVQPPYGNFDITSQSITTALRLFNLVSKPGKKIKKEKIKHVKVLFVLHVQISGVMYQRWKHKNL